MMAFPFQVQKEEKCAYLFKSLDACVVLMCLYVFIDVHMKAPLIQLNKESKYTMVTFMNICAKIMHKDYL